MPNIQVQLRRGDETANVGFTGASGEVVVNTSNSTLRVHDGVTAGGHEVLKGDNSFLIVDNTGITANDNNADADFVVKANGSGTLINADAGDNAVDLAPTTTENLAIYNPLGGPSAIEGGQLYINKSTQSSGSFLEANSFSLDAYKDVANSYQHGTNQHLLRVITSSGSVSSFADTGAVSFSGGLFPIHNGAYDLGTASIKWQDVYSTTGAFNGSDVDLKQDIEELSEAERRVAVASKGLIKKYRFKQAVEDKGEDARYHFGIIAQELEKAFQEEGLDPMIYGIIAVNTWYEKYEDGKRYVSITKEDGYYEVTERSIRYNELLAFIIAAL